MVVVVDGRRAVLKEGTSFEYTSENKLFSDAEDFTMDIVFPLRGCNDNIKIFGNVWMSDVSLLNKAYDCSLISKQLTRHGALVITDITNDDVKGQFLAGRSKQNYKSWLDDMYINELDLGKFPEVTGGQRTANGGQDSVVITTDFYAFPWLDGAGKEHNIMTPELRDNNPTGYYVYANESESLSYQIKLSSLITRIAKAIGYTMDISIVSIPMIKNFVVCNSLVPKSYSADDVAYWKGIECNVSAILPKWSVKEFFAKLEKHTGGVFSLDSKAKHISYTPKQPAGFVSVPFVLDAFTCKVEDDAAEDCKYIGYKGFKYSDGGHNEMYRYSCQWYIEKAPKMIDQLKFFEFPSSEFMINDLDEDKYRLASDSPSAKALGVAHTRDDNMFFLLAPWSERREGNVLLGRGFRYIPINEFAPSNDKEDGHTEVDFVPVGITWESGKGDVMSLPSADVSAEVAVNTASSVNPAYDILRDGEMSDRPEFYDKIFIAYYDDDFHRLPDLYSDFFLGAPHPVVSNVLFSLDLFSPTQVKHLPFSLRLNTADAKSRFYDFTIDPTQVFSFKFLHDVVPDVHAVFNIRGKRYLCAKLKTTFSDSGGGDIIEGEFYRISDEIT